MPHRLSSRGGVARHRRSECAVQVPPDRIGGSCRLPPELVEVRVGAHDVRIGSLAVGEPRAEVGDLRLLLGDPRGGGDAKWSVNGTCLHLEELDDPRLSVGA